MIPHIDLEHYRYVLPKEKIALYPASPRDASKLLYCSETGEISSAVFKQLPEYIPEGALMVFNQTKVIRARLIFQTSTGAHIEIFCLEPAGGEEQHTALTSTGSVNWKCLVGNVKKWKSETLSMNLFSGVLKARLKERNADFFIVQFDWTPAEYTWAEVLEQAGKMPLPPYIKREASEQDQERYQTVYANTQGSVAAPTAGLHFTGEVLEALKEKGVRLLYTTLHVGAGTFKPIKTNAIQEHAMHAEEVVIDCSLLEQLAEKKNKRVVAVGTTSVRCIESLYWLGIKISQGVNTVDELNIQQWDPYNLSTSLDPQEALETVLLWMRKKNLNQISIKTSIIIVPGYRFKYVDFLITNFHQPESTLMLLVSAFLGNKWRKVYDYALENDFRFLSYGDSSLLCRNCE